MHSQLRNGSVAQLNRASDYGSEGSGFESQRSHKRFHVNYKGIKIGEEDVIHLTSSFSVYYRLLRSGVQHTFLLSFRVRISCLTSWRNLAKGTERYKKSTLRYKFVLHYVLHSNLEMCYTFIVASNHPHKADDATQNFKRDEKEIG